MNNEYISTGTLTVHGVEREQEVSIRFKGSKMARKGTTFGLEVGLLFNRTDFGLDYGNPDFVKYVESYGGKGWRVDSAAALLPMVKNCLAEPAVHLIDVPVDYTLNDETLNQTLRIRSEAV